jgi:hypothetical protein
LSLVLKREQKEPDIILQKDSFFTTKTFVLLFFFICIITFSILLPYLF